MRIIQPKPRKLLKLKYVYRADREWISKRLRFHQVQYDESLYTARQIIKRLALPEVRDYYQSVVPTSVEMMPIG
jgi:hypothetical protein